MVVAWAVADSQILPRGADLAAERSADRPDWEPAAALDLEPDLAAVLETAALAAGPVAPGAVAGTFPAHLAEPAVGLAETVPSAPDGMHPAATSCRRSPDPWSSSIRFS